MILLRVVCASLRDRPLAISQLETGQLATSRGVSISWILSDLFTKATNNKFYRGMRLACSHLTLRHSIEYTYYTEYTGVCMWKDEREV